MRILLQIQFNYISGYARNLHVNLAETAFFRRCSSSNCMARRCRPISQFWLMLYNQSVLMKDLIISHCNFLFFILSNFVSFSFVIVLVENPPELTEMGLITESD